MGRYGDEVFARAMNHTKETGGEKEEGESALGFRCGKDWAVMCACLTYLRDGVQESDSYLSTGW